jgi:hypothetical protein
MLIAAVTVPSAAPAVSDGAIFSLAISSRRDASLSISLKMRVPRIMAVSNIPPREQPWAELHPSN